MEKLTFGYQLRIGGMITVAFSVVAGLLTLFVLPAPCSAVSGIQLFFLFFLNLLGLCAFIFGLFLSRSEAKN